MSNCTVYIDESGDLGYQRGKRWFVLSAVIVNKEDEQSICATMDRIKKKIKTPGNEIHFKKITDFGKRAYTVRELSEENFTYINIVADTGKLNLAVTSTLIAYNYICRFLLERVSWFLRASQKTADIVLSARGTSRDDELIDYIQNKLIPNQNNQVDSGVFEAVYAEKAGAMDLLQLADVCATTTFLAHEVNEYGIRVPCYFKVLESHLYRHNGKYDNYGLKYFSEDMKLTPEDLQCDCACMKKERTPGATTT